MAIQHTCKTLLWIISAISFPWYSVWTLFSASMHLLCHSIWNNNYYDTEYDKEQFYIHITNITLLIAYLNIFQVYPNKIFNIKISGGTCKQCLAQVKYQQKSIIQCWNYIHFCFSNTYKHYVLVRVICIAVHISQGIINRQVSSLWGVHGNNLNSWNLYVRIRIKFSKSRSKLSVYTVSQSSYR